MTILKLASKITAIVLIFGVSTYILLQRTVTEQTIEIHSSIGLLPTVLIGAIVITLLLLFTNALKQSLRESKLGWLSIIFFGAVLATLLFGIWFVFNSLLISLQANVDDQMAIMEYHKNTVFYMMIPITIGISIGGISKLLEFDMVKKWFK
jgi:glucan phosphoethanolaminetransferase (alkaline phosphatase superfamily)